MYIKYNNFCSQEKQNKNLKQELIEVIKKFVVLLLPSENRENQNKKTLQSPLPARSKK